MIIILEIDCKQQSVIQEKKIRQRANGVTAIEASRTNDLQLSIIFPISITKHYVEHILDKQKSRFFTV